MDLFFSCLFFISFLLPYLTYFVLSRMSNLNADNQVFSLDDYVEKMTLERGFPGWHW